MPGKAFVGVCVALLLLQTFAQAQSSSPKSSFDAEWENYLLLKSALLDEIDDSLAAQLDVLEQSAISSVQDSLYDVAMEFLTEAGQLLEQLLVLPDQAVAVEEKSTGVSSWETRNSLSLSTGIHRYTASLADEELLANTEDTLLFDDRDWFAGITWDFQTEKTANKHSLLLHNTLWLNDRRVENEIGSRKAWGFFENSQFSIETTLKGYLNLPTATSSDSSNGMEPGLTLSWMAGRYVGLYTGVDAGLYTYQTTGYYDYVEPWAQLYIFSLRLPLAWSLDMSATLTRRQYLKQEGKEENYNSLLGYLDLDCAPSTNWSITLGNFMESRRRSLTNYNGDYFVLENSASLDRTLWGWLKLSSGLRMETSYNVSADSTGGYRYYNQVVTWVPGITIQPTETFSFYTGYEILLSRNSDGTVSDKTLSSQEDYQEDGLVFELQISNPYYGLTFGNRYRYHYALNGESALNKDELSNCTSLLFDMRIGEKWTVYLNTEWCGRWQHTGEQEPDVAADLTVTYQL